MRILIIEDEPKIAQFTAQVLSGMSYVANMAASGDEGRKLFSTIDYDLVILDIKLPDVDGLALCKEFKSSRSNIPILMLTTLSQIYDKVRGLDSGADDYMTKPFSVEEFSARVRALLRRNQEKGMSLKCADLSLDVVKREANRDGKSIKLTTKEFGLLEYLLRNTGRPLSRAQIAQHVWDLHFDPESNIVDAYVKQLRKKIDSGYDQKLIKTIVGLGYVISED